MSLRFTTQLDKTVISSISPGSPTPHSRKSGPIPCQLNPVYAQTPYFPGDILHLRLDPPNCLFFLDSSEFLQSLVCYTHCQFHHLLTTLSSLASNILLDLTRWLWRDTFNVRVFSDVTSRGSSCRRFEGTHCICLRSQVTHSWIARPWRWRKCGASKRRKIFTERPSVTYQKTWIFSSTAVITRKMPQRKKLCPCMNTQPCRRLEQQHTASPLFIGAFAEPRKATISLIMSVRHSLSARNNTVPTEGIFMKFCIWFFSKICREN